METEVVMPKPLVLMERLFGTHQTVEVLQFVLVPQPMAAILSAHTQIQAIPLKHVMFMLHIITMKAITKVVK